MSTQPPFNPAAMSDNVKEQAQQIWLAGLGAFAKVQEDGTKAFEKLVRDGLTLQRQAHHTAEEKIAQATAQASQAANTLSERATGQWGKLENIFEDRVAKAAQSLGLPSANDIKNLQVRVAALEALLSKNKDVQPASKPKAVRKPAASAKVVKKTVAAKKARQK